MNLISSFVKGEITTTDFESKYLALFKNDPALGPDEVFLVLNKLFTDVDAFCDNPDLRDEDDLNEEQLRQCSVDALEKLRSFMSR